MSTNRTFASAVLGACLAFAVVAGPATAHAAVAPPTDSPPTLPQVPSAQQGATWLRNQFTPAGYIPSSTTPGQADLAATANAVLALASAGIAPHEAQKALAYLESNVHQYVTVDGSDGPGQLALLILDAHALRVDPRSFGGTNLVSRLRATERKSGANTGLFGVQNPTFDGTYRQGLSLAALAAAGVADPKKVGSAETWLLDQQCPDGGWTSYITAGNPCTGDPVNFEGPDTNSTALAIDGLSAQRDLGSTQKQLAIGFITRAQDHDGGWGYEPNAGDAPGSTDPDSTALVVQAIRALGKSPSGTTFDQGSANPVSVLLGYQLNSGPGTGAFFFPGSSSPNMLATYQAVPTLAGVTIPFDLVVTTSGLPTGTAGVEYSASLSASGGNPPYTWALISGSGALPQGLSLNGTTGVISGTPKKSGASTFTVEVFDTKATTSPHTQNLAWRVLSIDI